MAKFKELQVGQKVRVLGVVKSSADLGTVPESTIGDVATITDINTHLKKWVRLDNSWAYKAKDLEIVVEDAPKPVRTEPVTTAQDVPVGTKVRIRDFRNNTYERSYESRVYPPEMDGTIGQVGVVTEDLTGTGVYVQFADTSAWAYCYNFVEPVVEQPVLTTESSTSKVDASTPVGTKVRVLRDQEDGYYKAGAVGTLGRHDGDDKPRVDFVDDFWYPHYDNLEIVPQDTPDTVCKPELEPEPVAPKELTLEDFVVTRVRVKGAGAKGTVIGHTRSGYVGVQHDVGSEYKGILGFHRCAPQLGKAEGAADRCYWYAPSELEIITEEV